MIKKSTPSFFEFVALMALMTSLVALSIDAMLPALPEVGRDLGVSQVNDAQLIVSLLFLGLAVGQIIYGPLSDSTGRKPAVYLGFVLFIIGTLMCLFAGTLPVMLMGRFLQGIGLAGPRIVSIALIRDQYEGQAMAKVMSFVMAVFIFVPMVAPAIGQGVLLIAHWRAIFVLFLILGLIAFVWFIRRQPETLPPESRVPFSLRRIVATVREVISNRVALGYAIASGFIFGAFLGYLNSSQQIFQEHYNLGVQFPLYFGILALSIGVASYLNGSWVMRYGMRALSWRAVVTLTIVSALFCLWAFAYDGHPPLWLFMAYCLITLFCIGILFGNLNALSMEPLGHIAGVGAAVVGSLSTFISLPFGITIGQSYNGTVLPLVMGFALLGALSTVVMGWVVRKK